MLVRISLVGQPCVILNIPTALFPFLTGVLTNFEGQMSYIYFVVAQTAFIFCFWSFFPTSVPSRKN